MLSFIAKSVKKIIPRRAAGGKAAVTLTRPPRRGINVPSLYLASKELSRPTSPCYLPPVAHRRSGMVFSWPHAEWRLVARVELVVDFQHSFRKDMGIDLRGGDIGMTQHLLDRP